MSCAFESHLPIQTSPLAPVLRVAWYAPGVTGKAIEVLPTTYIFPDGSTTAASQSTAADVNSHPCDNTAVPAGLIFANQHPAPSIHNAWSRSAPIPNTY